MLCGLLHSVAPSHKRCCSRQVRKNKLPKLNESSFIVEYGSGELQKGNLFMEELSMHRTSQFANLYDHLTRQVTQHKGVPRLLDPVEPLALISRSDSRDDSQFVSPLHSLKPTPSSALKMDGWNTIFSFWGPGLFSGATVDGRNPKQPPFGCINLCK